MTSIQDTSRPRKAMIVGLDGASPELAARYIRQGRLPNLERLMRSGFAAPALPTIPTATSINWTTIATGAWPGTHGIVDMDIHLPGKGHPTSAVSGFDTRLCQAEYLWNAVERGGKLPVLLRYTCSWPPTVTRGIQVDGDGKPWTQTNPNLIAPETAYASGDVSGAVRLTLRPAEGWEDLPGDEEALEAELVIPAFGTPDGKTIDWPDCPYPHMVPVDSGVRFHLLLRRGPSGGYETLTLSRAKQLGTTLGILRPGEWSAVAYETFESRHGRRRGAVWFKLLRLSGDGEVLLFAPEVFPCDGVFTVPESLAAELTAAAGPYLDEPGHVAHYRHRWAEEDLYFELLEYQADWFVKAAEYLSSRYPWDLFMMQAHGIDWSMHVFTGYHGKVVEPYPNLWDLVGRNFEIYDRMIGRLMAVADEDTVVVVVSDHGAIEKSARPDTVATPLLEAGLLAREPSGRVDWSRTKACPGHSGIWVNLEGRDPGGIVAPGAEYEQVRDAVIAALYDFRDAATGKRKVALALRREDARVIGLYGERVPDVVCVLNPEFGGNHGELPTAALGGASLNSLFVMAGPGVKRGASGKPFWLVDVAPTVAHLIGAPRPRDAEGRVLHEALDE